MENTAVTPLRNFVEGLSFWRLPRTFAENFSRVLDASGLTGRAVANLTGIVESQISDYKTGKVAEPGLFTVVKLAKAMGCTVEDLVVGVDDEYDRVVRELACHDGDQQFGTSSHVGDSLNDPAAARVLRLTEENHQLRIALEKITDVAGQLVEIAKAGVEVYPAADVGPSGRNRD